MSTKKPTPTAIPTIYGWADPQHGDILVSVKNLANPVLSYKKNARRQTLESNTKILSVEKTEEKVEENVVESVKTKQPPKKPSRPRTRKSS